MELDVKRQSSFKDIQRFKQIAEILKIEFVQAEELFWLLREKTVDERYLDMVNEIKNNPDLSDEDKADYWFIKNPAAVGLKENGL